MVTRISNVTPSKENIDNFINDVVKYFEEVLSENPSSIFDDSVTGDVLVGREVITHTTTVVRLRLYKKFGIETNEDKAIENFKRANNII